MQGIIDLHAIAGALFFSFLGLAIFSLGFRLFAKLAPFNIWKEIIDEHNTALAIIVGAISLGICQIISAAIK